MARLYISVFAYAINLRTDHLLSKNCLCKRITVESYLAVGQVQSYLILINGTVFLFSGWEPPNEKQYHKKFTNRSVYGFGEMGDRFQTNKRYESVITKIAPLLIQEGGPRLAVGWSPHRRPSQPTTPPSGHPSCHGVRILFHRSIFHSVPLAGVRGRQ